MVIFAPVMNNIRIDYDKCVGCRRCVTVCPSFVLEDSDGMPIAAHPEMCIACGHCVSVCTSGAICHEAFPAESIHRVQRDMLPTPEGLMELMRSRRSNRTMTAQEIPEESLRMIMQAGAYAPTAENKRGVRMHLVTDAAKVQEIEDSVMDYFMKLVRPLRWRVVKSVVRRFFPELARQSHELTLMDERRRKGQRVATVNCKAILVFTAHKESRFGYQDANLAYQNASLMAESLGVSQVYLGFVQTAFQMWGGHRTSQLLGIGKDDRVFAIMALGMPSFRYPMCVERT